MLWENYQQIEEKIGQALRKAGREEEAVKLIAVSKTKPLAAVEELAAHGVRVFGENKVQELCEKQGSCSYSNLEWHFIGHLQRNKVKQLLKNPVALIHSLDSERLALALEKEAAQLEMNVPVLVEVNIGNEASKTGFAPEAVPEAVKQIAKICPHLHIEGLMCIAPAVEDPEQARPYFQKMHQLKEAVGALAIDGVTMKELSMGMTGDYQVAIEEGATMVRVGTAIFGERDYSV